jgi:hypothetical protein
MLVAERHRWGSPPVDRLFVGIERGALGYLVIASRERA